MSEIAIIRAAYVAQRLRAFHQGTRGIATPEQREELEMDFDRIIASHDAEKRAEWEADRRAVDEATRRQVDGLANDYYEAVIRAELAERGERGEWEAEQGEVMTGEVHSVSFEDGTEREPYCGLEGCELPDHEYPPMPVGMYVTIRLDDSFDGAGSWRVQVKQLPVSTTNNESEGRA